MSRFSNEGEMVEKLTAMGISEKSAKYALKRMNGDVERAANFVFSGEANKEEVSKSNSNSGRGGPVGSGGVARASSVRSTTGSGTISASTSGSGSGFVTASEGNPSSFVIVAQGRTGITMKSEREGENEVQMVQGNTETPTPKAPGLVPLDIPLGSTNTPPRPTDIDTVSVDRDAAYLSPLKITSASASAPSPMKGEVITPLQPALTSSNNNNNITGVGNNTGPGALTSFSSPGLRSPSTLGNPSGLDVIHENEVHHADGEGQEVPPLLLGDAVPVEEAVDGLGLSMSRASLGSTSGHVAGLPGGTEQEQGLPKDETEQEKLPIGLGLIPIVEPTATPSSRRSSVTFNEPPLGLRPGLSRQNSDSPEVLKMPQTQTQSGMVGMSTPSRVTSATSSTSENKRGGKERDLPRTETMTSFELGESDFDEVRGRSKDKKRVVGAGLFKRKKKDKRDGAPRDESTGDADIARNAGDDGEKRSKANKRMSFFDVGNKIKDMMTPRRKDTGPVSEAEEVVAAGDISTGPETTETELTPEQAELENRIAHLTRRARGSDTQPSERDQNQTPGARARRQDSEPATSPSPIHRTPTRGILKITNDAVDPSFAYDDSQSLYSPSRPGSVFFTSPANSVFVSPANSPTGLSLPLPMLDDGDIDATVPEPSTSTLTKSNDDLDDSHTERPADSPVAYQFPATPPANDDNDDEHDGDSTSTRTVTPTSSKFTGFGRMAMTTIPSDSRDPIPASTSAESTSSGGTIVSPTNDQQANDLIMGALNRKSGSHGHLGGMMHKSSSTASLGSVGSTKTTGALAALGLKAMGPGLGGFSAADPVIQPSQPVGSSSFDESRQKTVNLSTSPVARDTGSIFSGFGGGAKEKERGRSASKSKRDKYKIFSRRSLAAGSAGLGGPRSRETSPVGALSEHAESDGESVTSSSRGYRPKSTAFSAKRRVGENADSSDDDASDDETENETETDLDYDESVLSSEIVGEDGWVEDVFDEETEKNTEANAVYFEGDAAGLGGTGVLEDANGEAVEVEVDVLGEGPNVIRPPEPVFQQSTMARRPPSPAAEDEAGKRKKGNKFEPEHLETSRPEFGRNRCTIRMTQGDPDEALEQTGTKLRSYVVLSDLSEEAGYALQWAIGTVARDGDELLVTTVMETDSKIDPKNGGEQDRVTKLRVQKERQTIALQLVRQVTGLLQRTKLNVTVTCQAIHSKNARHMLLDLIDYLEPTMVIVGSRGLGKLQGILLGSTSHYLVQKSSVPVMVARRRLKKPLRKTDPALLRHAPRVSLAGASIEKSASKKQEDEVLDAEQLEREGELDDQDKKESMGGFSSAQ